jgi:hypothetical protein
MSEQQLLGDTPAPVGPNGPQAGPEDDTATAPLDLFGFKRSERFEIGDGVQWISFHAMNEGEKRKFQSQTTKDFIIDSKTRDTRVSVDPGTERKLLIEACADDWHIFRSGEFRPFNKINLSDLLELADPSFVERVEKFVRDLNPWMLDNVTVEAIDEEIADLQKAKERLLERQAGEAS